MIIAILGPKSEFAQFGIDVLLSTLEAVKGNAQFYTMIDLDVDALDAIARQSESAVVNCTLPSSELCRQLEMRGIPFVILLDNGAALYRKLRTMDGLERYDAIRAASLYLATLHDVALENPTAIFKGEELSELGPERFSIKLIDSLHVLAGDATVDALVKTMVARKAASNAIIDRDDSQLIVEEDDSLIGLCARSRGLLRCFSAERTTHLKVLVASSARRASLFMAHIFISLAEAGWRQSTLRWLTICPGIS